MNKHEQNLNFVVKMGLGGTIGKPEHVFELGSDTNPKGIEDPIAKKAATVQSNLKAYVRELLDDNFGTGYAEIALEKVPEYLFSEVGEYAEMFIPQSLRDTLQFTFDEVNQQKETVRTVKDGWVSWKDIKAEYDKFNTFVESFRKDSKCQTVNTGINQDVKISTNQPKAPVAVGAWTKVINNQPKAQPAKNQPKS